MSPTSCCILLQLFGMEVEEALCHGSDVGVFEGAEECDDGGAVGGVFF